jgi:hypothetical protein
MGAEFCLLVLRRASGEWNIKCLLVLLQKSIDQFTDWLSEGLGDNGYGW